MYGELLISLCRSVPLRICNGRMLGDTLGSYTCYKWNGNSTVDYCLASPGVYNKISSFQVDTWLPHLSDHCPILICLKTDIDLLFLEENDCEFNAKSLKIEWDKNIRDRFENIIQSYDSKVILSNFALQDIASNQESVDSATDLLTDFLVKSAQSAGNNVLKIVNKGKKKPDQPNWKFRKKQTRKMGKELPKRHDETCENMKIKIKQTSKLSKIIRKIHT